MPYYGSSEQKTLKDFWDAHGVWSEATFGTTAERGPLGPLKHLAKEVQEAIEDTGDTIEMIDCLFLIFDALRRSGLTHDEVVDLCFHKLEINKKRKWPKTSPTEPAEHIKLASPPQGIESDDIPF